MLGLIDNNLPRSLAKVDFLKVNHCSRYALEKADDIELFNFCNANNITYILTKDKDFEEIVFLLDIPPKIIQLTCGNLNKIELSNYLENRKEEILSFIELDNNEFKLLII